MREVLLVLALAWSGTACVESGTQTCGTSICPGDTTCVEELGACFDQLAVDVCTGVADAEECSTPSLPQGRCFSGVCRPEECGNGIADGLEDCDGDDLRDETCASIGYYDDTPTLKCGLDCRFDGSECTGFCGDGVANGNEPCDGDDLVVTCSDFGYYQSEGVQCSSICTALTDMCEQVCGDGVINGPELCDGNQPTDSCLSLGYDRGFTDCSTVCALDFAGCDRIGLKAIPQNLPANLHMWASPSGRVYGAGVELFEFNGTIWDTVATGAGFATGLWGTSDSNIYQSNVLAAELNHFDGTSLTQILLPGDPAHTQSVHGTAANDVYVATDQDIVHFDGTVWTQVGGPIAKDVFALNASNVYAVELNGGGVWHYNGIDTWTQTNDTGYTGKLTTIWGTSTTRLFAGGAGVVLSYDGTDWTRILDESDDTEITNIKGTQDLVLAVGYGGFYEYDGIAWTEHDLSDAGIVSASDVIVQDDGSLLAIGGGTTLFGGAGARSTTWFWGVDSPGYTWSLNDALAFAKHDILAVGNKATGNFLDPRRVGMAARYTNGVWQQFTDNLPAYTALNGLWSGDEGASAVAVGERGTIRRIVGTSWTSDVSPVTSHLNAVWGSADDNIIAVGNSGTIVRYGSSWIAEEAIPTTQTLNAVTGFAPNDIYAVGNSGAALHYNGSEWATIDLNTARFLKGVWGSAADDVYIVGGGGTVIHYDGTSWAPVSVPTVLNLEHIYGTGPDDIYIVGGAAGLGVILHYDGIRWSHIEPRTSAGDPRSLIGVTAFEKDAFFFGGNGNFEHLFRR